MEIETKIIWEGRDIDGIEYRLLEVYDVKPSTLWEYSALFGKAKEPEMHTRIEKRSGKDLLGAVHWENGDYSGLPQCFYDWVRVQWNKG